MFEAYLCPASHIEIGQPKVHVPSYVVTECRVKWTFPISTAAIPSATHMQFSSNTLPTTLFQNACALPFAALQCLPFISPVAVASYPSGAAGSLISSLAGYRPALTYCSSRDPVPPVTKTAVSTATVTVTVATSTATVTIATTTSTLVSYLA